MRILALDTSFNTGAVAIVDGESILADLSFHAERMHSERSMQALEAAFELAGVSKDSIDLIAVGAGPGGFTSVRVGIATAKGLALARDLPIVGLSSLQVLARSASPAGGLVAALSSAGRGEHFGALYELFDPSSDGKAKSRALVEPRIGALEDLEKEIVDAAAGREFIAAGETIAGAQSLPGGTSILRASALAMEARSIYEIDGASDLDALAPLYLRESDAKLPAERLRDPSSVLR